MSERLGEYRRKRDFGRTPEPGPGSAAEGEGMPRFVVQEHHATRLHWDLRLEHEGALASWAVPNGIPEDPDENRKAVHTEDHPLEYLDFEGEIPAGSYGAGRMTIWDRGTFELHKWEPRKVVVTLHGERLSGRYALFQAGRSEKDWLIHRMDPPADPEREPTPEHVVPMLAKLGSLPARDEGWAYEIKWDGVRAIAHSEPGRLRLESRNLNDITASYPELRALNGALGSHSAVLDGEIVAFDADGRPSFARLQQRMHLTGEAQVRRRAQDVPVTYVIFDLLHLDGRSLLALPYGERRRRLDELALEGPAWRTPAHQVGRGAELRRASREQGLEGVVAKRLDRPYEPGKRSGAWIKVKNTRRAELVIGGWLPGEGRRGGELGALLVGSRDEGGLRYAGRVGTGFGQSELEALGRRLAELARSDSPFGSGRIPRGARFVEPLLVAEVEFTDWTRDGLLRHPSYKGLLEAAPRPVRVTNADKVLFPETGFTKGNLIAYYERVADALLPHLQGRSVSLRRYPDGAQGKSWWERDHRIDDLPALLEAANSAAIELHPLLARADRPGRPTAVVFDLDPGPPAGLEECCEVALALRGMLGQLGLESLVKTSGGKGLQVYLPLNGEDGFDATKAFARAVARTLERGLGELVVSRMTKAARSGKVLVDWSQNEAHKSTVAVYSLRARGEPSASLPLDWGELERPGELELGWRDAVERVEAGGDPFAPVLTLRQRLPAA